MTCIDENKDFITRSFLVSQRSIPKVEVWRWAGLLVFVFDFFVGFYKRKSRGTLESPITLFSYTALSQSRIIKGQLFFIL